MDRTIFTVYRNSDGYCEASILTPSSKVPSTMSGEETPAETVAAVKADYGEDAVRLPAAKFRQEVEARSTHTQEMLALLRDTYAGDLRTSWVYGSVMRPMSGIRIEGAVILNANGARYNRLPIYDYVVVLAQMGQEVIDHYDFVLVSHP